MRERGSTDVFEARGLSKVYHVGDVQVNALRAVDFDLSDGEFVVLLGPSGSGKSTLLNLLGGLDVPTGGRMPYRGRAIWRAADERGARRVPAASRRIRLPVLQPDSQPHGARERRAGHRDRRDPMTAHEALRLVGLAHRMNHYPAQLSGGEQQRVAIARAIAKRPAVLLCDEPTGRPRHHDGDRRPRRHRARSIASSALRPSSLPTTRRSRTWPTA